MFVLSCDGIVVVFSLLHTQLADSSVEVHLLKNGGLKCDML